ncbi:dihydropteroate synthase [Leptospira perolatii]|nr:dihydropteroate synthase [Leptospira perolatii]
MTMNLPPKPLIFGILNITSDSFFDGGKYLQEEEAIRKAIELKEEGADVIDIGAQSSNIKAEWVDPSEEWKRIETVISELKRNGISISVDTYKPLVMRKALESGVDFINNIRGYVDSESLSVLREFCNLPTKHIIMYSHNHGNRAEEESHLTPENVMPEILEFFEERVRTMKGVGVPEENLIFDPGMGFFLSSDFRVSFSVIRQISELRKRFPKLMVSVTRKSFLGNALGGLAVEERGVPTAVSELYLWSKGVPMIRTHSPSDLIRAIDTWRFCSENS